MRRLPLGMATLAVLLLAACGGGGSDDSSSPTVVTAPPASTAPTFSGSGSSQFCQLANTYRDRVASLGGATTTAAQVRQLVTELSSAIDQAVAVAPPEIKADVTILAAAARDYAAGLRQAGYDIGKVPDSALQKFRAPDAQEASSRLQAYDETVCRKGG